MEYYKHTAEKGDVGAMVQLGKLYYHGSQGVPQDLVRILCMLVVAFWGVFVFFF